MDTIQIKQSTSFSHSFSILKIFQCVFTQLTNKYLEPQMNHSGQSLNKTVRLSWKAKEGTATSDPKVPYLCHSRVILLGNKISKIGGCRSHDRGHHKIAVRIKEKLSKERRVLNRPTGKQNRMPPGVLEEDLTCFFLPGKCLSELPLSQKTC